MPYICKNCSNKTRFNIHKFGSCYWDVYDLVDENFEEIEEGDCEYDDYDTSDEEYKCAVCGSQNVEEVSEDEWEKWKGPLPPEKTTKESWKDFIRRR